MAIAAPPSNLSNRIDQLLKEREEHVQAVSRIDDTLSRIHSVLGGGGGNGGGGRGMGMGFAALAAAPSAGPGRPRIGGGGGKGTRRRRSFATTGDEMVVSYVRDNKGATTAEIKKKWASEGRGGTADNAITKLVKEGKLKRLPLDGQRGSRYTLP